MWVLSQLRLPSWPTHDTLRLKSHKPACFRVGLANFEADWPASKWAGLIHDRWKVMDDVDKPSSLLAMPCTWSQYKHYNTAKYTFLLPLNVKKNCERWPNNLHIRRDLESAYPKVKVWCKLWRKPNKSKLLEMVIKIYLTDAHTLSSKSSTLFIM